MRYKALLAAALAAATRAGSTGCASSGGSSGSSKQITVWSEENDASRVQATQQIIAGFTKKTGIKVKLVGVDGSQFDQLVTSAAAAGKMPDVMGALPLDAIQYLAVERPGRHRPRSNKALQGLGTGTLDPTALKLTQYKGKPARGAERRLRPAPRLPQGPVQEGRAARARHLRHASTKAAAALSKNGMAGITAATVGNDVFTEQTFEDFALANGCQLVDANGKAHARTASPASTRSTSTTNLIKQHSVPGTQDVDTTRATYFAGKAAMVVWSSYILDEMAGLRNDALPTCPECRTDPAFLAKNSGFVTSMKGPDGTKPEQFGEINSWTDQQERERRVGAAVRAST